jgi:hypothetical protein
VVGINYDICYTLSDSVLPVVDNSSAMMRVLNSVLSKFSEILVVTTAQGEEMRQFCGSLHAFLGETRSVSSSILVSFLQRMETLIGDQHGEIEQLMLEMTASSANRTRSDNDDDDVSVSLLLLLYA